MKILSILQTLECVCGVWLCIETCVNTEMAMGRGNTESVYGRDFSSSSFSQVHNIHHNEVGAEQYLPIPHTIIIQCDKSIFVIPICAPLLLPTDLTFLNLSLFSRSPVCFPSLFYPLLQ